MHVREYAPIFHGFKLANQMLGDEMPEKAKAEQILRNYEVALRDLEEKLLQQGFDAPPPEKDEGKRTYGREALGVLRGVLEGEQ